MIQKKNYGGLKPYNFWIIQYTNVRPNSRQDISQAAHPPGSYGSCLKNSNLSNSHLKMKQNRHVTAACLSIKMYAPQVSRFQNWHICSAAGNQQENIL